MEKQAAALAETMPVLAGAGLEPPRFHPTGWGCSQTFSAEDDPDRTAMPWEPPCFLAATSAAERAAQTQSEELPMPFGFARVVRGVFGQEECAELISRVNSKGFTPALLNIGGGFQKLKPEVRDGHRVIVDSPELATWLLEVLRPHLPEEAPFGNQLVDLNERCRFLCYTPGQVFEEHRDGCYTRPFGHPHSGDRSVVTVQMYLHDVPVGCGGATTFFPGRQEQVAYQPEAGSVLLFSQDLPHEGSLVKAGLKYTLRTEAMYGRVEDEAPPPCSQRPRVQNAPGLLPIQKRVSQGKDVEKEEKDKKKKFKQLKESLPGLEALKNRVARAHRGGRAAVGKGGCYQGADLGVGKKVGSS